MPSSSAEIHGLGDYAKNRRELLDVLGALHNTGIQEDSEFDLPKIVVVGSQSVGKSSLIEAISDIKLPRDSGTCTRCPMECRLGGADQWSCSVTLRYTVDAHGKPLPSTIIKPFGPIILEAEKDEVEDRLRRAQRAILNPEVDSSAFLSGLESKNSLSFSRNCVCIDVKGPRIPELYFYDLPGLFLSAQDDDDKDGPEIVHNLVQEFISTPNCIILLVVSCGDDFENQAAWRLISHDQSLRQRTVGVLTKVDRIDKGTEQRWIDIVRGTKNKLLEGWFAVRLPTKQERESGESWDQAKSNEVEFFATRSPWSQLGGDAKGRLGRDALAEHLGKTLTSLAHKQLPVIYGKILERLKQVDHELLKYPRPNYDKATEAVIALIVQFLQDVKKHIDGFPPSCNANLSDPFEVGLIHCINNAYQDFRTAVHRTAPKFRPWCSSDHQNVSSNAKQSVARDDSPDGYVGKAFYVNEVMKLATISHTRELPGIYPFSVNITYIEDSIKTWPKLTLDCFSKVESIFEDHITKLAERTFRKYASGDESLLSVVKIVAHDLATERATTTTQRLQDVLHQERNPFTQNDAFYFARRSEYLTRYKSAYHQSKGKSSSARNGLDSLSEERLRPDPIDEAILALAKIGFRITREELPKLHRDDAMDPALEIMAQVRAYFEVAYRRMTDAIPNQIDAAFVQGFDRDLSVALLQLGLDEDRCRRWLEEPSNIKKRREDLMDLKASLEQAKEKLAPLVRRLLVERQAESPSFKLLSSGSSNPDSVNGSRPASPYTFD